MIGDNDRRTAVALLILRLSLGIFLLQWSLEKFIAPSSAAGVAKAFYGVSPSTTQTYVAGAAELVLALALLVGVARRWTYGAAFLVHAVSVAATWQQLFDPYGGRGNHLFIAGIPVLAAFFVLYLLRRADIYSIDGLRERSI
ncbi:MAG TPA: DoxX family membrane protein [Gammaproteobacteria bacterium]|nr:DoxX family membrane protein [Gammaproteobacteria bacterium]